MPDRSRELLDLASRRILILDGAMGTMIQRHKLTRGGVPRRALSRTDLDRDHQG
jgi:methionine synthase I (cobalamin-dependent)